MNAKPKTALSVVILALLLVAAAWAGADPVKIRVKTGTAVLRLSASPRGEVAVDKVAVGTVFDAVRKTGAWYEVRHRSEMGVLLTAYINEADVEVIGAAPAIAKPVTPTPQAEPRATGSGGLELAIGGGLAMPSFKDWSGTYADSWSWSLLQSVSETGTLSLAAKGPVSLGLAAAYFFNDRIGVQLRADLQGKQSFTDGASNYAMTWTWSVAPGGPFTQNKSWGLTGEVSVLPISLSGVYRFVSTPTLQAWAAAGLSIVVSKVKADSTAGYATSWVSGSQYIDYFGIPIQIDKSATGFGINAGVGAAYHIGSSLGIFLEAVYFGAGKQEQAWTAVAGTYPGVNYPTTTLTLNADDAAGLADKITKLTANLSFLKLAAGVRIRL